MVIDKGVTMADLKGTLNTVVEMLYGKGTKTRFPPPPPSPSPSPPARWTSSATSAAA